MTGVHAAAVGLLCAAMPLTAQASPEEPAVRRLLLQDGASLQRAKDELLAARRQLIADLCRIIRDHENQRLRGGSVRAAMSILGEMRAPEAAQVLAEHIAFPQKLPLKDHPFALIPRGSGTSWPAAEALIKIGAPCVPAVLDKLASTDHPDEGEACLAVLDAVRERDSVSELMEKTIAQEMDGKRRSRLEAALGLLSEGKVTPLRELGPELFRTPHWPPPNPAP